MIYGNTEKVFIYNNKASNNLFFQQLEDLHSFSSFSTDNIFQLQQYTEALTPRVTIFNITDAASLADLKSSLNHHTPVSPLVVVAPESMRLEANENVAHYIRAGDMAQLTDVVESYCLGNKKHDVMLLLSYSSTQSPLQKALSDEGYSIFSVHQAEAARQYLARNKPRIVCVEYAPRFIVARHMLFHPHIFYVDRAQDITEIKKFLL
ncbi:MAG: hypothetical protein IJ738_03245 [Alphaproteobacteria bacterium]|nr:hypothetical protein [Alphaproteobacteria bacterium]